MAHDGDNPLLRVRSIMEALVLDERKMAKVPDLRTQAVLIDMEDTVARDRKLEGRAAVLRVLAEPEVVGDQLIISRPNALDTEWGHDDTVALARAGAQHVMVPMATSAADVLEYRTIFDDHDVDPLFVVAIETPGALSSVESIAALDGVGAFAFGEGDLTASMGIQIFEPDGTLNPILAPARSRAYVAAHANHCAMFDVPFLHDLKDVDELRVRGAELKRMGATGLVAIYPPHVAVINDLFTPTDDELEYARTVVEAYERALANGEPAVQLPNGKAVLIHDHTKAVRLLEQAGLANQPQ